MNSPVCTMLLVDDHPLFVDGFAGMLRERRPDWLLLTTHSSDAACNIVAAHPEIAIAIVDIKLPDQDGFETVARMRDMRPGLRALIVSGRDDATASSRALQCGALGFVSKTAPADTILQKIDQILRGASCFDHSDAVASPELSPRQVQVLALLAEGHANKEIRHRLGIAERTVRAHLTDLFQMLAVTSRMQAIVKARALGLID